MAGRSASNKMAFNEITDADIRAYILGKSPAEETDQLDELSFADQHAERIGAVEHEIIDDYVSGRLSPEEKSAFESSYMASAIRRERVEFAKAFADYSERTRSVAEPSPARSSIFDLFRQRLFVLQFGAVAMLLILGAAAWLIFRETPPTVALNDPTNVAPSETRSNESQSTTPTSPAPTPSDETQTPSSNVNAAPSRQTVTPTPRPPRPKVEQPRLAVFVLTPALRSSSFQQVEIPAGAATVEFQLRLETDDPGPLSVEIIDLRNSNSVWSAKNLSARKGRSGSTASIRIPSRVLNKGEYQVSLSKNTKDGKSEKIGDYFFSVAP